MVQSIHSACDQAPSPTRARYAAGPTKQHHVRRALEGELRAQRSLVAQEIDGRAIAVRTELIVVPEESGGIRIALGCRAHDQVEPPIVLYIPTFLVGLALLVGWS